MILCLNSNLFTRAKHFSSPRDSLNLIHIQKNIATAFKNSHETPKENKRIPVTPENSKPSNTQNANVIQIINTRLYRTLYIVNR